MNTSGTNPYPSHGTVSMPSAEQGAVYPTPAVGLPYYDPMTGDREGGGNLAGGVVHALRRKWFAIAVLGLVAGVGTSLAVWYLVPTEYTATARLRVPYDNGSLFSGSGEGVRTDYDLRKRTQAQLITGIDVLKSVVQADEIRDIKSLAKEADKEAW